MLSAESPVIWATTSKDRPAELLGKGGGLYGLRLSWIEFVCVFSIKVSRTDLGHIIVQRT